MSKRCDICGKEIGILDYYVEFPDGEYICKECARKAGIYKEPRLDGVSVGMVKQWIHRPEQAQMFFDERQRQEEEAVRLRIEAEQKELEEKRIAEAEAKKQRQAEANRLERERFPEGRVRVILSQVSFTEIGAVYGHGNSLDAQLQQLQNQGCHIMNVTCFSSGRDNKYVQAVIVYREPPV